MPRSRLRPPPGTRRHDFELWLTESDYERLVRVAERANRSVAKQLTTMIQRLNPHADD